MAANINQKTILVAGGTGLIGRPLTTALAADGHNVIVLTRATQAAALPPGVRAAVFFEQVHPGVDLESSTPRFGGETVSDVQA